VTSGRVASALVNSRITAVPSKARAEPGHFHQKTPLLNRTRGTFPCLFPRVECGLERASGGAEGPEGETADFASKGLLAPHMREWSDTLRELANDSAHPKPGQPPRDPKDANDVTQFLDFLLEYLYSPPHQINLYRETKER
jgi:hypothetical protein